MTYKKLRSMAVIVGVLLMTLSFMTGNAQSAEYPKKGKHITWIVTHSPGGGYDTTSRMAARVLSKILGVDIIIVNMPGAGGRVGVNAIYRAKPDGYTIGMIAIPGMMVTQLVSKTKFDILKFKHLGRLAVESYDLAVNPKSPFKSVKDMQNSKTPLRNAVTGGGTGTVYSILASNALNIPHTIVTGFKGSTECLVALMAGDVDYTMTGSIPTHAKYAATGDIRVLTQFTKKRHPALPDVPTVLELGLKIPDYLFAMQLQRAMVAPPGTPPEIVETLRNAFAKVVQDKAFLAWAGKVYADIDYASGPEMEGIIKSLDAELPKFRKTLGDFFSE